MKCPIVIAAGGTGGHVVPALAVAAVLNSRDVPVVWFGTQSGLEARMVPAQGIQIEWISVAGLRGKNLVQRLLGPFRIIRSCIQSVALIHRVKPRAVLGMGGYVSGPVGIAALLLRKPLILHEQNAVAGMTNRYLSKFATRVFCAWPGAFDTSRDAVAIGNPVRAEVASIAQLIRVEGDESARSDPDAPMRILVVGGSRGARALNEVVPAAVALLGESLAIVHQAGSQDVQRVRDSYVDAPKSTVTVVDFIDDMSTAYQQADLIICRSGAMTVTELSAMGLPAILVPFPFAVDDHQTLNARFLSDNGAALLVPQESLTAQSLCTLLESVINDRQRLRQMSQAARACFSAGAAETVASALLEVSH
ncbi:MAG: undecaprenyldiphospho-muramoylpentapeptide beta-N-acetylglucosaminyltransferase [Granulosicoccus sp.]